LWAFLLALISVQQITADERRQRDSPFPVLGKSGGREGDKQ
jgi:hypothetical protein